MDNTQTCPMNSQIVRIISSPGPKCGILQALSTLEKIASGLLSPCLQNRYKTLTSEDPLLCKQMLNIEAVHEFLLFIGYREDKGTYLHGSCDETMKILEDACKILSCYISQYKLGEAEEKPEIQEKENRETEHLVANDKPKKKECKITSFLMRHLRKEQTDTSISGKYQAKKCTNSNYAYNSEGYFHQSANSDETIRKKDPRKDLFEDHEKGLKNKRCFFSSFIKRK